jgi:hypothetical protein
MPRRLALALALACLSCTAWADFRADYSGGAEGNAPSMSRIEVGGSHMRMDAGKISMLLDADSGKMIMLVHDKHQYMDMAKMAQMASAAMAQMNASLANLPPEQRAMVEQRMHGAMGAAGAHMDIKITPTGATDRVGNWSCQVYRTDVGDTHVEDSCLADVADAGISAADRATIRRAFERLKEMSEKMSAGMFKSPLNQLPEGKFPVKITHFDDGNKSKTVVLTNVTSGGVNAADFAIPAGYTEQEPQMHGPPGRQH